jgi:hypothetical protein
MPTPDEREPSLKKPERPITYVHVKRRYRQWNRRVWPKGGGDTADA